MIQKRLPYLLAAAPWIFCAGCASDPNKVVGNEVEFTNGDGIKVKIRLRSWPGSPSGTTVVAIDEVDIDPGDGTTNIRHLIIIHDDPNGNGEPDTGEPTIHAASDPPPNGANPPSGSSSVPGQISVTTGGAPIKGIIKLQYTDGNGQTQTREIRVKFQYR